MLIQLKKELRGIMEDELINLSLNVHRVMKTVKCMNCGEERLVKDDCVMQICPACQDVMEEVDDE